MGNPRLFTYNELSVATDSFSEENQLGQGGFGVVYKANLKDGTQVAVKKLSLHSKQGKQEFVNELNIITGIRHRNLAMLHGYCVEANERLLVYEFLENGSLDSALFQSSSALNWQSRFQITIGIARGLAYLHEESHFQIIHRDIKASNVLLDAKLQPKISDFGLSKLFDLDGKHVVSKVAGTFGYMAPEYAVHRRLSPKADVFSFGVPVLVILSGRKCVDLARSSGQEHIVQMTWKLCEAGKLDECVDWKLGSDYDPDEVYRMVHIALLCTQEREELRPVMSDVVTMLLGRLDLHPLPTHAPGTYLKTRTSSSTGNRCSIEVFSAR
ncbi:hypothetical protein SELMODRAFT_90825 [Selaginella moellendorffii]|uniref:non-specific serine/threonine protein kinase n=1 Tax=Selaginella moellendorffii TaxID=88036 RepID=D8RCH2_SELML|nr:hypothetical protein SELMODRAFT_90825 [Selaginella moellendorffii]